MQMSSVGDEHGDALELAEALAICRRRMNTRTGGMRLTQSGANASEESNGVRSMKIDGPTGIHRRFCARLLTGTCR